MFVRLCLKNNKSISKKSYEYTDNMSVSMDISLNKKNLYFLLSYMGISKYIREITKYID